VRRESHAQFFGEGVVAIPSPYPTAYLTNLAGDGRQDAADVEDISPAFSPARHSRRVTLPLAPPALTSAGASAPGPRRRHRQDGGTASAAEGEYL